MSLGAIGAFFGVLVVIFIFGNLWFNLVEAILKKIKRIFGREKESAAWHTLGPEEKKDDFI